jgi:hypothetical protein
MQVEALEDSQKKYFSKTNRGYGKYNDKASTSSAVLNLGVMGTSPTLEAKAKGKSDAKLQDLMTQRRKAGLCMKCGDKWNRGHKCPTQIPLQVMEELMEAMQMDLSDQLSEGTTDSEEELLALSLSAVNGVHGKKTMTLQGKVGNQTILILLDSGSSSTFISSRIVELLQLQTQPAVEAQVTLADGGKLISNTQVQDFTWWVQGNTFTCSARVLELPFYDVILGMDWLETYSPMWIHWQQKRMRFFHQGKRIVLQGLKDCTTSCAKLKATKLKGLLKKGGVA